MQKEISHKVELTEILKEKGAKDAMLACITADEPVLETVKVSFVYDDKNNIIGTISESYRVDRA